MNIKSIYTSYRFKGYNYLCFSDNNKWYNLNTLREYRIKYKNGRNGIYIDRKFISVISLRKLAYIHRELIKVVGDFNDCPF